VFLAHNVNPPERPLPCGQYQPNHHASNRNSKMPRATLRLQVKLERTHRQKRKTNRLKNKGDKLVNRKKIPSSSSSCSLWVRCVPCSLVLKVQLVPPSLLQSSKIPSSFRSVFQCLSWQSISVHPLYVS